MPSAKVLAMREADATRRLTARVEQRTCAMADCGLPGGVQRVDYQNKIIFTLKNSHLVERGEGIYVHADPAVCDVVAKSHEAARRRASTADLSPDRTSDVPAVRDGDTPTTG